MRWPWLVLAGLGFAWLAFIFSEGAWPPVPADFSAYWGGAKRVLAGDAPLVYDGAGFQKYLSEIHQADKIAGLRFPYPPSIMLLIWPLGLLSFPVAWIAFLLPGMAAFFFLARRLTDNVTAAGMTFAVGGPIHTIQMGQNGYYVAVLLVGGLLMLSRSKPLAGIAIGLLAIKPHLAVVAFLALVIWREWRALCWAIGTILAMAALSILLFGTSVWLDFIVGSLSFTGEVVASQKELVQTMHQTLVGLLLGLTNSHLALALHSLAALCAIAICFQVKGRDLSVAAVCAATLVVTPYAYLYDTVILVLACALLIRHDQQLSLILALLVGATGLWFLTSMPIAPFCAIALLLLTWLRSRASSEGPGTTQAAKA